jgi:hypothetical protein
MSSGIGSDLVEVYAEVGASIKIYKPDGTTILGEYLDFDINRQVTKPFIREFFLEASFIYATKAEGGVVVEFVVDGRKFLVMNLTGELFENEIIGYNAVLYKCNEVVTIKRLTKGGWDGDYKKTITWPNVAVDVPILLTERFFGTGLGAIGPQDFMEYDIFDNQMYISAYYGVKPLDRVWLSDTEFFQVDFVEKRKFEGVHSCVLSEDTRGV